MVILNERLMTKMEHCREEEKELERKKRRKRE
jgi:hypothetical protein